MPEAAKGKGKWVAAPATEEPQQLATPQEEAAALRIQGHVRVRRPPPALSLNYMLASARQQPNRRARPSAPARTCHSLATYGRSLATYGRSTARAHSVVRADRGGVGSAAAHLVHAAARLVRAGPGGRRQEIGAEEARQAAQEAERRRRPSGVRDRRRRRLGGGRPGGGRRGGRVARVGRSGGCLRRAEPRAQQRHAGGAEARWRAGGAAAGWGVVRREVARAAGGGAGRGSGSGAALLIQLDCRWRRGDDAPATRVEAGGGGRARGRRAVAGRPQCALPRAAPARRGQARAPCGRAAPGEGTPLATRTPPGRPAILSPLLLALAPAAE